MSAHAGRVARVPDALERPVRVGRDRVERRAERAQRRDRLLAGLDAAEEAALAKKVKATKAGRFSGPKITCSETAGACRVAITFTTKKKGKRIVAARAKATIKAGKRATPSLKLLKPAKALLKKKHSLSLTGTVKVTDAAGNSHSFPVKTRLTAKR